MTIKRRENVLLEKRVSNKSGKESKTDEIHCDIFKRRDAIDAHELTPLTFFYLVVVRKFILYNYVNIV